MKKLLLTGIIAVLLTVCFLPANAMSGIGLYGNLVGNGTGTGGGGGLTIRSGSFPVIGLEWNFLPHNSIAGVSLDAWLVNQPLSERLSYYLGIGGYAAASGTNTLDIFNFGARIPLGLQLFPVDPLEIFLEVAPMIILVPAVDWTVSARLGFRILY
jgi:hypothetical protein